MSHPAFVFKYCPQCSSDQLVTISQHVLNCPICHFRFYINPAAAVAGIITNNKNEILVVRRAKAPKLGLLDLPGGFVDIGESAEEALKRELLEELNLSIINLRFVASHSNQYVYKGITYFPLDMVFECDAKSFDNIMLEDEVSEYFFTPIRTLDVDQFAFKSIQKILTKYKNQQIN